MTRDGVSGFRALLSSARASLSYMGSPDLRPSVMRYEGARAYAVDESPSPVAPRRAEREVSFAEVVAHLRQGGAARRPTWVQGAVIAFDQGTRFVTLRGRVGAKRWQPYIDDLDALDWELVERADAIGAGDV